MTQIEFETRTRVNVTAAEFETINSFYMSCECDKDVFCKMWVKMNPGRVTAAKVQSLLAAREQARRDTLWGLVNRSYYQTDFDKYADEYFKTYELVVCESAGLKIDYKTRVRDVLAFANNYLCS